MLYTPYNYYYSIFNTHTIHVGSLTHNFQSKLQTFQCLKNSSSSICGTKSQHTLYDPGSVVLHHKLKKEGIEGEQNPMMDNQKYWSTS